MIKEYILDGGLDELGNEEEFTHDAELILPWSAVEHLDHRGLPRIGTRIEPGMIIIGKFGARAHYARSKLPHDLERWSHTQEEMIAKYKHMFYDASLYASEGAQGIVTATSLERLNGRHRAIVCIKIENPPE